jgi:hypothetical protein
LVTIADRGDGLARMVAGDCRVGPRGIRHLEERFPMKRLRLVPLLLSLVALMSLAAGAVAQEASPAADDAASGTSLAHPAHIHVGPCAELDPNPTYPLNDVTQVADSEVATSTTTIDATLDELLASPFAINAHESAENIATYIACGDIVGPVVDGVLLVPMRSQNDSGISGIAVLATNDAGGVDVTVYLTYPESSGM